MRDYRGDSENVENYLIFSREGEGILKCKSALLIFPNSYVYSPYSRGPPYRTESVSVKNIRL